MLHSGLMDFLKESNKIEGITRPVTDTEMGAARTFLELKTLAVEDVCHLVSVFQPRARLRDKPGMDVRVGDHVPIRGSALVATLTKDII